jgi:acyl carrier protein
MDVLLHVAGFVTNLKLANDVMGICKEVGAATILRTPVGQVASQQTFDVYCSTFDIKDGHGGVVTISDAYALDSAGVFAVFKGMVFQHVKLARIDQALSMVNRSSRNSISQGLHRSETEKISEKPVRKATFSLPPAIEKETPSLMNARESIKDLVAKVCGLSAGEVGPDSRLEALCIDSLMMIELESELESALGTQLSMDAMANCDTVGDIENLCKALSSGISSRDSDIETPPSKASSSSISTPASEPANNNFVNIIDIITDICGAQPGTVALDSGLSSLGVDSLLFLELTDRLQQTYGNTAVPSAQLQVCRTVGDIGSLVRDHYRNLPAETIFA